MNKYTYCLNNPIIYIDPDGQDIFKPEWGQGRERKYSLKWAIYRSSLMQMKLVTKLSVDFYNWTNEHKSLGMLFNFGATTGTGIILKYGFGVSIGGAVGGLIGVILVVMYISADQYFADYWNDEKFVELWNQMENYLDQLVEGYNCEIEYLESICELAIYLLQKEYGENWREHAPPELLAYYDEMEKRKNQSLSGSDGDIGDSSEKNKNRNGFDIV